MTEFNKLVWRRTIDQRGLTPTAVLVLNEMFDRANMDGTAIYGSQVNIAEKIGKSVESVRRAQKQLRSRGLIRLLKSGSSYGQKSSSFVLTYPDPDRSPVPTSPVKSSPGTEADRSKAHRSFQTSPVIPEGLTGHFGVSSPVTGEGLIDPLPDPGHKPGSVEETSPVTEADRSTEPPTSPVAAFRPRTVDNQPPEGELTMASHSHDPWATAPETTPPAGAPTPADVVKWPADKPLPRPGEAGYRPGRVYRSYTGDYLGTADDNAAPETPATQPAPSRDSDSDFWGPPEWGSLPTPSAPELTRPRSVASAHRVTFPDVDGTPDWDALATNLQRT